MKKRILVLLPIIMLLTLVLTFGSTTEIASAHSTTAAHTTTHSAPAVAAHTTTHSAPAVAAGCGSTSNALWIFASPENFFYYCSGYKYVDYEATAVDAGGWSGWFYSTQYGQVYFCNGNDIVYYPATVHVTEIYMSPTLASWC